jgi:hypothetical protein
MSYASIYVMKAGEFVKIGFSKYPDKRLKQIQTGNPVSVELLCSTPGFMRSEAEIHSFLRGAGLKMNGEWYREKDVRAIVQSLMEGNVGQARSRAKSRYVRAHEPKPARFTVDKNGSAKMWNCCDEAQHRGGYMALFKHFLDTHGATRSQAKAAINHKKEEARKLGAMIKADPEYWSKTWGG